MIEKRRRRIIPSRERDNALNVKMKTKGYKRRYNGGNAGAQHKELLLGMFD